MLFLSVAGTIQSQNFVKNGDPFGCRNFIENKGQYGDINGEKVFYALDNGLERIFFTSKGLTYELLEIVPLKEEERERAERSAKPIPNKDRRLYVHMRWENSGGASAIEPSQKQTHYFTFGGPEYNSYAYKKILYRAVYPHIDIEYVIPDDKETGIKYNVIAHPGADLSNLVIVYSGAARKISLLENGSVRIKTALEDIIEHAPYSFTKGGRELQSNFSVDGGKITLNIESGPLVTEEIVIDPWVSSTSTLTSNTSAFDVDYDFLGNTFVYGGNNPFKVAMYDASGSLQWVFGGTVSNPNWTSAPYAYASNFGVNRFNSKCYIGQGYAGGGSQVIRLTSQGAYDNFMNTANSNFQEVWDMGFHCLTAEVFVLGGGTTSNITAVSINSVNAALTLQSFQPTVSAAGQDIVSHAIDDQGNVFVIGAGATSINNRILRVTNSFTNNLWNMPSGFSTFSELGNKSSYANNGSITSNGFNALAVNGNYLYYYDGSNLSAYNKTTGALTASTTVPGLGVKVQGGIAVDDCDHIYLGGQGSVRTYSFNGTAFSTLTPISLSLSTVAVYDLKLDKSTKKLYASGYSFVGILDPTPTNGCPTASSACLFSQGGLSVSSTSITCAHPGSATVTAIGGTGPFSYTWLPSSQTGSTATNLNPGSHAVVVHDNGQGITYTASVFLQPLVPLTGTVPNTLTLNCHGVFNGTAAVSNFTGGSGHHSYLWTGPSYTQTAATATALGLGNYTWTIRDSVTNCVLSNTFTVLQPPALTLNVAVGSPSACAGSSITLTPLVAGGTPNYTYKWANGPATGIWQVTNVAGAYIYTLTAKDSKSCTIDYTVPLTFANTPTLTVTSASICPQQTGTISVSGASTYTWNTSLTGDTLTDNPLSTTIYTVTGYAQLCTSQATAAIVLKNVPVPVLNSNSPRCAGSTLQLQANGGGSYLWTGPQSFNASTQLAQITNIPVNAGGVYNVTVTAANSCTAAASLTAVVNPTPVVSALGSTLCETSALTLQGNSSSLPASFVWTGPGTFTSNQQNAQVAAPLPIAISGNYTVTATDQNGCFSSAVAHVTVSSVPQATLSSNSPVCENGQITFTALGASSSLIYAWSGPDNFTSNLEAPSISSAPLSAAGAYSLSLTNGPCVNNFNTPVVIHALPVITIQGGADVCETKTLNLSASATGVISSWLWAGPGNFYTSFPSFSRSPADPVMAGIYTITTMNVHGCFKTETIGVQVLPNPTITVSDMTVCLNAPAVFEAQGAVSYLWTGPGGFLSSARQATLQSASNPGKENYTVIGTAANSCTSSAVLQLSTRALPVPAFTVFPASGVCEGQNVSLSGSGGVSYRWYGPEEFFLEGQQVTVLMRHTGFAGTYTLAVTDSSKCSNSTEKVIPVYPLPGGDLKGRREGCVPLCAEYSPLISGNTTATWRLNGKALPDGAFSHCFTTAKIYTITATFVDTVTGCSYSREFNVDVYPKPLADFAFEPEQPVENSDQVTFTPSGSLNGDVSYTWYDDHNQGDAVKSTIYSTLFETEGTYRIAMIAESDKGCLDSVVKVVRVEQDFLLFIPNAFTPNTDDLNTTFKAVTRGVIHFNMQIFDRWGALIFETNSLQSGWDGMYKGKACKEDVYIYKVRASDKKGNTRDFDGHLTLYR